MRRKQCSHNSRIPIHTHKNNGLLIVFSLARDLVKDFHHPHSSRMKSGEGIESSINRDYYQNQLYCTVYVPTIILNPTMHREAGGRVPFSQSLTYKYN